MSYAQHLTVYWDLWSWSSYTEVFVYCFVLLCSLCKVTQQQLHALVFCCGERQTWGSVHHDTTGSLSSYRPAQFGASVKLFVPYCLFETCIMHMSHNQHPTVYTVCMLVRMSFRLQIYFHQWLCIVLWALAKNRWPTLFIGPNHLLLLLLKSKPCVMGNSATCSCDLCSGDVTSYPLVHVFYYYILFIVLLIYYHTQRHWKKLTTSFANKLEASISHYQPNTLSVCVCVQVLIRH